MTVPVPDISLLRRISAPGIAQPGLFVNTHYTAKDLMHTSGKNKGTVRPETIVSDGEYS